MRHGCGGTRRAVVAAISAGVIACSGGTESDSTPTAPESVLTTVTVSLGSTSIAVGQSLLATATGADQNGKPYALTSVSWSSSSPSVAIVDGSGRVTAVAPGTTAISASAGSRTGQASLTVVAAAAGVTVTATTLTPSLGQAVQLAATVRDSSGAVIPNATVAWASDDTSRAVVSSMGIVVTRNAGTVSISAVSGTAADTAALIVGAAPAAAACKLPAYFSGVGLGFPRVANRLPSTGTVHLSVIFVDFANSPATVTPQHVFTALSPAAEEFFAATSYGGMSLVFDPNYHWFRMSQPSTAYGFGGTLTFALHKAYTQEAVQLADPTTDFSHADGIVVMAPPDVVGITYGPTLIPNPGGGFTLDGHVIENAVTSGSDLLNWPSGGWLAHETGHSMGLVDLYAYDGGGYSIHHFVGTFSLMGLISGRAPEHLAWERWLLDWLRDDQVYCAPGGVDLVGLSPLETAGGTKMLVIPTGTSTALVIEYRTAAGYDDQLLKEGLLVYLVDTAIPNGAGVVKVLPIMDADGDKSTLTVASGEMLSIPGYAIRNLGVVGGQAVVRVTTP